MRLGIHFSVNLGNRHYVRLGIHFSVNLGNRHDDCFGGGWRRGAVAQEAGDLRLEAEDWRREVGSWMLEIGDWRREAKGVALLRRRLET